MEYEYRLRPGYLEIERDKSFIHNPRVSTICRPAFFGRSTVDQTDQEKNIDNLTESDKCRRIRFLCLFSDYLRLFPIELSNRKSREEKFYLQNNGFYQTPYFT